MFFYWECSQRWFSCCLQKAVSPSLCVPLPEFIFSKQGSKKQILQVYLSILAFCHGDRRKSWVFPASSNNMGKLSKKPNQRWIAVEKVVFRCSVLLGKRPSKRVKQLLFFTVRAFSFCLMRAGSSCLSLMLAGV